MDVSGLSSGHYFPPIQSAKMEANSGSRVSDDLLYIIVGMVDDDATLRALARTNRTLSEQALGRLWKRSRPPLSHLARLMPKALWQRIIGDEIFSDNGQIVSFWHPLCASLQAC
jgi:hypothetical protein